MPLISLCSDYGLTDPYLASVKAALYREQADLVLCDLSHGIAPGDLNQAAFILRNAYHHFPEGTVHLILVAESSPKQRWLVMELAGHFFLAADNGLLTMVNPELRPRQLTEITIHSSFTLFPGRDFLAKAAAHLARGGKTSVLGRPTKDFEVRKALRPSVDEKGESIVGAVLYIDNFGNLITNISQKLFKEIGKERSFEIVLPRNNAITEMHQHYHAVSEGRIMALFNSMALLEIALQGGRGQEFNGASSMLGLKERDAVKIYFKG